MKKEKFEIKVNNLILLILDWCEKKKLRCVQNGLSVYFDLENLIFEDVKNELKEYLIKESGIKKIKKMITFLYSKQRTYIIFKTKNSCYA